MVNSCSVIGCSTNYIAHEKGTVFRLPEDEEQKGKWLQFLNRKDVGSLKHVFICYKHFENDVLQKTPKRVKLNKSKKPVPTIAPASQKIGDHLSQKVSKTIDPTRNPTEENLQDDRIKCIEDIVSKGPKSLGKEFTFQRNNNNILIYKLE